MISTAELLAQLDPLPYPDRMAALSRWARGPAGPAVLQALAAGSSHERFLALTATMIIGAPVTGFLQDPDPGIQALAVKHCLRTGAVTGDALVALVADAPAALRQVIYRTLRSGRLAACADTLIDAVMNRYGDAEAGRLLPSCGPDTARRVLPLLDHAVNLSLLARRHPELLLDHVESRLTAAGPDETAPIWSAFGAAVVETARPRALDLLDRYAPPGPLPGPPGSLGRLAAVAPARVAALLATGSRTRWLRRTRLPGSVLRRLAVLGDDDLVPLARLLRSSPVLLAALPPHRRGGIYDASWADADTSAMVPAPGVVEVLPEAWRVREAERVLRLDHVRTQEDLTLQWSAYLPWDRAREALAAALRSGDAAVRSAAYGRLVAAARRSRDRQAVAVVVETLLRLRNEQDPVRAAALGALAGTARLLTAGSASVLTRITDDATQARDGSAATLGALRSLAVNVLQHHIGSAELREWSLHTLDVVSAGGRVPPLGRFDRTLRRGQEVMVVDRLRGWIEAAMKRGEFSPLFAVTRALGRRARLVPDLQDLLARAIRKGNVPAVVQTAIGLWLDDPATRDERVARVLDVDSSAVVLDPVWRVLSARRTDLLDRVLTGRGPKGQFLAKGPRWVPGPARHIERWLPRQREAYVQLQARVAADAGAGIASRAAAIRDGGPALALRYVDADDVTLSEAALGALGPGPESLAVLLEYADTERARVAMYAAGRAVRSVAPARLPALLGGIVSGRGRVTSRKEAARLLAAYGPPQAMESLLLAYRQEGQHRDVRAAIVAAARMRPQTPRSWDILAAATAGSREEQLAVLAAAPEQFATRVRPRYATLVADLCRADDREVAGAAYRLLPQWLRYLPAVAGLVVDRTTDLDARQPAGLVGAALQHADAEAVGAALRQLVAMDAADTDPGGPDRDRRARRRITFVADGVVTWAEAGPGLDRTAALAAARWLAGDPLFESDAARMLTALVEVRMPDLAEIVTTRPVLAARTAAWLEARVERERESLDPGILAEAAELLRQRGDTAGGLLALALVRGAQHDGWPAPWRDLLLGLRQHPDPDVRDGAYRVRMSRG